jgi:hypothetical protein
VAGAGALALSLALASTVLLVCVVLARASTAETLPLHDVERLTYVFGCTGASGNAVVKRIAYGDFAPLSRHADLFQGVALIDDLGLDLDLEVADPEGRVSYARALRLDPMGLEVLGARFLLGGGFGSDISVPATRAVVLSEHIWRRLFSADPSVLGRFIQVGGQRLAVVGVLSGEANLAVTLVGRRLPIDLYTSIPTTTHPGLLGYLAIGRLKDGVSIEHAADALRSVSSIAGVAEVCLRPLKDDPALEELASRLRLALWFGLLLSCIAVCLATTTSTFHVASNWRGMCVRLALGGRPSRIAFHQVISLLFYPWILLTASALALVVAATAVRPVVDVSSFAMPFVAKAGDATLVSLGLVVVTFLSGYAVVLASAKRLEGRIVTGGLGAGVGSGAAVGSALSAQSFFVVLVGVPVMIVSSAVHEEVGTTAKLDLTNVHYLRIVKADFRAARGELLLHEVVDGVHITKAALATGAPFSPGHHYFQGSDELRVDARCRTYFTGPYLEAIGLGAPLPEAMPGDVFASRHAIRDSTSSTGSLRDVWAEGGTTFRFRGEIPVLPHAGDSAQRPCVFVASETVLPKTALLIVRSSGAAADAVLQDSVESALVRSGAGGWVVSIEGASVLAAKETRVARLLVGVLSLTALVLAATLLASMAFVLGQRLHEQRPQMALRIALGARNQELLGPLVGGNVYKVALGCLLGSMLGSIAIPAIFNVTGGRLAVSVFCLALSLAVLAMTVLLSSAFVRYSCGKFCRRGVGPYLS